jgi:hypothetical protein
MKHKHILLVFKRLHYGIQVVIQRAREKEIAILVYFHFDSSSCGLSLRIKNITLETSLDFFELFLDSSFEE